MRGCGASHTMRKEEKLVQKVKGLVRKAGLPRWLHHMGPKKYEFWHHAIALVVKEECKLGFRRVSRLLKGLGFHVPSYSALQKMRKRIPFPLWKRLLAATCNGALHLVALDGTGLSFPLPSPYYYKRIDKPYPVDIPLKLSLAVDTKRKKILAVRLRVKPRHDIKDAKYLIDHLPSKPFCIIADKGYDANWLHEYCNQKDIKACIPKRNWNKPRVGRTKLRHTQKHYHKKRYGRREIIESIIGAIKRKFGMSVTAHSARTIRAEVYCRAITHNILTIFKRLFQRSPPFHNLFKSPLNLRLHGS